MSKVREAVAALGGMKGVCRRLGIDYAHEIRAPWRPDEKGKKVQLNEPHDGRERFYDHKEGEGGDEVDFWAKVKGIDGRQACLEIIGAAGLSSDCSGKIKAKGKTQEVKPLYHSAKPARKEPERVKPILPAMRIPTPEEVEIIAQSRRIPVGGVDLAVRRGFIKVGEHWGSAAWFYIDESGWNCRVRRLDGQPFMMGDDSMKAVAVKDAWASYPIGLSAVRDAERVMLVEGETDALAAWALAHESGDYEGFIVIVMAGASLKLPWSLISAFQGKRVRIVPDPGRVGERAGFLWAMQLQTVGASVDVFVIDEGHSDLGDMVAGELPRMIEEDITNFKR